MGKSAKITRGGNKTRKKPEAMMKADAPKDKTPMQVAKSMKKVKGSILQQMKAVDKKK